MYATVCSRRAEWDPQGIRRVLGETSATHGLTGFCHAHLHDGLANRSFPQVVIERDDAIHFGARQVERLRNDADGRLRHVTEFRLHLDQQRKQVLGVDWSGVEKLQEIGEVPIGISGRALVG